MTPKERARLRGLANGIDTVLQIGKDGIGDTLIHQADITLETRELIKGRVLDTCMDYTPRAAAEALALATNSEVVQVIGSKFVLYRKRKDAPSARKEKLSGNSGARNPRNGGASGQRKPHSGDAFGQRKPRDRDASGQRDGARKSRYNHAFGQRKPRDTRNGDASGQRRPQNSDASRKNSGASGQRKPHNGGASGQRKPHNGGASGQRKPRGGARPDRKTRK